MTEMNVQGGAGRGRGAEQSGHRRMWGWRRRHRRVGSGQEEEGDPMASPFSVLEERVQGLALQRGQGLRRLASPGLEPFTRGAASRSWG